MEAEPSRGRRRVLGILLEAIVLVAIAGVAYSLLREGGASSERGRIL